MPLSHREETHIAQTEKVYKNDQVNAYYRSSVISLSISCSSKNADVEHLPFLIAQHDMALWPCVNRDLKELPSFSDDVVE